MTDELCESCKQEKPGTIAAVVNGTYYRHVCSRCLHGDMDKISGGVASFNRRRDYEDNAQDTVQPYDSVGPNPEFLRLYPDAAKKVFSPEIIEQLKKKL